MIGHVNGDLLQTDADIICHQVNCQGVMGSGLALQIKNKYPYVFRKYKEVCDNQEDKSKLLGSLLLVETKPLSLCNIYSDNINSIQFVANIFAQNKFGREKQHTNYDAMQKSFYQLSDIISSDMFYNATIAMPWKIGCDRGGGDWDIVYKMIDNIFSENRVLLYKL